MNSPWYHMSVVFSSWNFCLILFKTVDLLPSLQNCYFPAFLSVLTILTPGSPPFCFFFSLFTYLLKKKKKTHFSSVFKKGGWRSKCNVTFNYMKMTLFYLHILLIVWLKNSELNIISPYWIEYCCFTVISLS